MFTETRSTERGVHQRNRLMFFSAEKQPLEGEFLYAASSATLGERVALPWRGSCSLIRVVGKGEAGSVVT